MWWWLVLGCGGDADGKGEPSTVHTGSAPSTTDPRFDRCVTRCTRGAEGPGCDPAGIADACASYCVDPPALPEACQPFFEDYEACVARIDDWTCEGSPVEVGGVAAPVPADRYECRLESDELETCSAVPDPGCAPTIGGVGAACTAVQQLCNAGGATYDLDLLCDGVICSLLVDDGAGPEATTLSPADELCAELFEKEAAGGDAAARFLLAISGVGR